MELNFSHINPTHIEHEGYYYLEFDGEYFKGCKRCGGAGHYAHNGEHDRCYECNNTISKLGAPLASKQAAEQWCHGKAVAKARRDQAAEAKRQVKVNMLKGYQAALATAAPDVFDYLMAVDLEDYDGNRNQFIVSMAEATQWVGMARLLSTNMINAVRKVMTQTEERKVEAAAHPAPAGRVAVTGEVVSTKLVEGDYGTAYKILVKDDAGFKVWCSLPKAQADEASQAFEAVHPESWTYGSAVWFVGSENEQELFTGIKGRRITFTATLEPSRDDVAFAFGSRPTKGAWI